MNFGGEQAVNTFASIDPGHGLRWKRVWQLIAALELARQYGIYLVSRTTPCRNLPRCGAGPFHAGQSIEEEEQMKDRQILWGLSGGASVLALAGFFWFGMSFGVITYKWGWWAWGFSIALQFGVSGSILRAAVRLRRRSEFTPSDLRRGDQSQREETQRIFRAFAWITLFQTVLIGLAVWWCLRSGAKEMIWPLIGLIVSAHFAPLARIFHVRAYYITALAGSIISLLALIKLTDISSFLYFGGAMAAVMWLSGWYILQNADQITARAMQEKWVV